MVYANNSNTKWNSKLCTNNKKWACLLILKNSCKNLKGALKKKKKKWISSKLMKKKWKHSKLQNAFKIDKTLLIVQRLKYNFHLLKKTALLKTTWKRKWEWKGAMDQACNNHSSKKMASSRELIPSISRLRGMQAPKVQRLEPILTPIMKATLTNKKMKLKLLCSEISTSM